MNKISCGICKKNFKTMDTYFSHIEKKHAKSLDCDCDKGGGAVKKIKVKNNKDLKKDKPLSKKEMQSIFNKARNDINNTLEQIELNSIQYGLKIDLNKKEINKIPKGIKDKVQSILMENEYLKGVIEAQENQIKLMKKQMDKCINNLGVHYSIYKK